MKLRPLDDSELEFYGLKNKPEQEAETIKTRPLSEKEMSSLKLLQPDSVPYMLAEQYKEAWGIDPETFSKRIEVKNKTGLPDFVLDKATKVEKDSIRELEFEKAPKVDWKRFVL